MIKTQAFASELAPYASVAQGPRRRLEAILYAWKSGAAPDTWAVLAGDPDLLTDKAIVLDLAYEEYCLRSKAGQTPDTDEYCDRFPAYRTSLRRVLAVHQALVEDPGLLAEATAIRWPLPGQKFGDFAILRELGRGSFARVFLATETSTGDRPVAVKLSTEGNSEAKTLGRLDHPNIVPILSARQDPSGLSLVCMPFLGSATLNDLLDRAFPEPASRAPERARVILDAIRAKSADGFAAPQQPADPAIEKGSYVDGIVHLAIQLAEALAFMHGRGVCHRDLKPSNVLLDARGRPLLLDFNLSSDVRVSGSRVGGTLPYMAPEQVRPCAPDGDNVSSQYRGEQADIYSLGVVLYELLTGKNPFGPLPRGQRLDGLATLWLERQREGCRPLFRFNDGAPLELARLVESCLAFDPHDRPASAATLAAGLRRHFATAARLRRWAGRRPRIVATAACGLVLFAGAAGWSAANRPPEWSRAHERGRLAFGRGDFDEADRLFDTASAGNRDNAASWFARGVTRLARGDVALAFTSFEKAHELRRDGRALACMAYCQASLRHFREAVVYADEAAQAGHVSPELLNNRAYALLHRGNPKGRAAADLAKALERDPASIPARYNRAMLVFQEWLARPGGAALPDQALADIRHVLDRRQPTLDLYRDAAYLFAAASTQPEDDHSNKAIEFLRLALVRGHDSGALRRDDWLSGRLQAHPAFPALVNSPNIAAPNPLAPNYRLCEPVAGLPE